MIVTTPLDAVAQEHLGLLLRTSRLLSSSLDIQELLDSLLGQVIEVIGAERGFILLRPEPGADWQFRSASGLESDTLQREDFRLSRGVIERVADQGRSILTSDAREDARFRDQASVALYQLRSILGVPVIISGRRLGVIYVDHRLATGAFDQEAQSLLEAIAGQAAVAIENALLVDQLKKVYATSLNQARQELAQAEAQLFQASKMAAIGQLAAGVAHEINNPLGALSLNLSSLKTQVTDLVSVRRLTLCEGAVERCRSIVSGLLTFAQPQHASSAMVDLADAVACTLELVEADMRRLTIRLVRELAPGLSLAASYTELTQIVLNLVLNARDGLAGREDRTIWVRTRKEQEQLILEVTDNGSGIPLEIQERIFEPFFTTKPVGQGVGLGLSICYQLVQRNRGEIRVKSQPGQGTRFTVAFPC